MRLPIHRICVFSYILSLHVLCPFTGPISLSLIPVLTAYGQTQSLGRYPLSKGALAAPK